MTEEELADWEADFAEFQSRFAHLFERSEPRQQAGKYLRGLMSEVQRKNGWQLAEAMGDAVPDATQRNMGYAAANKITASRAGRSSRCITRVELSRPTEKPYGI